MTVRKGQLSVIAMPTGRNVSPNLTVSCSPRSSSTRIHGKITIVNTCLGCGGRVTRLLVNKERRFGGAGRSDLRKLFVFWNARMNIHSESQIIPHHPVQ